MYAFVVVAAAAAVVVVVVVVVFQFLSPKGAKPSHEPVKTRSSNDSVQIEPK